MRLFQGMDIVHIPKFRDIAGRHPQFIEDAFTPEEREYCRRARDPYIHFAGRFAAKESCLKALGTGLSGPGPDGILREIEVVPDGAGRPQLRVSGWAATIAKRRGITQMSVTISHAGEYAVASVLMAGG